MKVNKNPETDPNVYSKLLIYDKDIFSNQGG